MVEDADDFFVVETEVLRRTAATTKGVLGDEVAALLIPVFLVGSLLLALTVVTVDAEEGRPPPKIAPLPKLEDWATSSEDKTQEQVPELEAVASNVELFKATVFQWRVFALETRYPTGFLTSGDDSATIELFRAVLGFFTSGLQNKARYERNCALEVALGPDATPRPLPALDSAELPSSESKIVRECSKFVDDFGVSVAAYENEMLGLVTLRARTLPIDRRRQHVGYVTGLAVARSARRRGVATALVDFCARKSQAWGCVGLCLHVNRLNAPALRFYASLGFQIVDDWLGFNTARFLLLKPNPRFLHLSPDVLSALRSRADKQEEDPSDDDDCLYDPSPPPPPSSSDFTTN